jgi:hypothetical protein
MPNAETSFADRLGRGRKMYAAIAGFNSAFAPADETLLPGAFEAFLNSLAEENTLTSDFGDQYGVQVGVRMDIIKDLSDRAARVLDYVASNNAWSRHVPTLKKSVDKIRGNRPKRSKPPAAGEGAQQKRQRNQGERSFSEMHGHLTRLIAAAGKITGYAPPAADLTIAALQTLADNLDTQNRTMHDLADQLGDQQTARLAHYEGPTGLREKMKAIKKATRSQYGSDSPEYAAVKSIRL